MTKQQSYELIKTTFTQSFDKDRFAHFVNELLNGYDQSKATSYTGQMVKHAFKEHVNHCHRLGTYTTPQKETIDILTVHLTKDSKLEKARTAIRNYVAYHLDQHGKDAALVAFVSPSEKQWRFSYVKLEYKTVTKDSGKIATDTSLTPARRFSYIVGEGESCHTAQTRFVGLLENTLLKPSIEDIQESFSVETVTKEFFNQYVVLFKRFCSALESIVKKDSNLHNEIQRKNINQVEFVKKLMGQIVFLYFLQRKGWLGVPKGSNWGEGPKDFLRKLANKEYVDYVNFHNDVLQPLFYDTLATDRGHEAWSKILNCRIPFLNGGLFEPMGDFDWKRNPISLPNNLFSNSTYIDEHVYGTGILDVFDRYNFTVNEAEPLEKEVAIDPEMLGKIFESLIEENQRKGQGAFYTPREIVHFMCQESLINYLDSQLNKTAVTVNRDDIVTFIQIGDHAAFYEAARLSGYSSYLQEIPDSIINNARIIDDKLTTITVCDPAVGSGAFPVGMMKEIVRCRSALTPYFNDVHDRTPYNFKRHAIQSSLYGADIDLGAVEIAKLRLWLSLVVDEENVQQIKPLPNLDYKIVAGNSLIGIEIDALNDYMTVQIEKEKDSLFDETDADKKAEHKKTIDVLINTLTHGMKVFDFELFFSEVFHKKDGFDVIIANPPYVKEQGHKEIFREVKKGKLRKFYNGKMDLFYFFFHLALNLTADNGSIAFITTNYFPTATGASVLRSDFFNRACFLRLINFYELKIFESALGQHNMVSILKKAFNPTVVCNTCITRRRGIATPEILKNIFSGTDKETVYHSIPQKNLYDGEEHYIRLESDIMLSGVNIHSILTKLQRTSVTLGSVCQVNQGIVSGCDSVSNRNMDAIYDTEVQRGDGVFVFDLNNSRDQTVISSFNEAENALLKQFFKNSNIGKYVCHDTTPRKILYLDRNVMSLADLPNINRHLCKFEDVLNQRREVVNGVISYFQLQWPRSIDIFTSPKIVVPQRSRRNTFAYNEDEWFSSADCYFITKANYNISLKYVLALLNSKVYYIWLYHKGKRKGELLELCAKPLSEIPIKLISPEDQELFIELVDEIILSKQDDSSADTSSLENEIDQLVYKLYDFSQEEIDFVENEYQQKIAISMNDSIIADSTEEDL